MKEFSVDVTHPEGVDYVVIKTVGSINSNTAPIVDEKLEELMGQGTFSVVIDFSATDFISSSGIGVFLGTVANLREKGGDLVLMNVPKLIEDIFEVLNLSTYFRVIANLDEMSAAPKS